MARKGQEKRLLQPGESVMIGEVKYMGQEHRIKGKLDDGNWISVKNTENGFLWVQPAPKTCPKGASS